MSIEQTRANATSRAAIDESLLGKSGDPSVAQALGTPSTPAPKTRKRTAAGSTATRQRIPTPKIAPSTSQEDIVTATAQELPVLPIPTMDDLLADAPSAVVTAKQPEQQATQEAAAAAREARAARVAAVQAQQAAEIQAAQDAQTAQFEAEGFAAAIAQAETPTEATPRVRQRPPQDEFVAHTRASRQEAEAEAEAQPQPQQQRTTAPIPPRTRAAQTAGPRRSLVNRELVSRLQALNDLDADSVERQLFDLRDMINKLDEMTGVAREMQLLTMAIALAPILEK